MPRQRNNSNSSSDVEIIEDSEPERQEWLAKLRLARQSQKQKGPESLVQAGTSQTTANTQTSVLSSSTSAESVVSSRAPQQVETEPPVQVAKSSVLSVRKPAPPPWLASTRTSTLTDQQANHTSPNKPSSSKSSSQPSPVKQMDLNGFAYQKRTIGRSTSYSTSARPVGRSKDKSKEISFIESCSDAPEVSANSIKASSSPKVFILGATKECPDTEVSFTAGQIASLSSCIVCGHAWTARKLPKHKWSHIMSCARKGGCDLDVLYMKLIAAVVDAPDPKVKKSIKGKGKEKAKESSGPQSLLAQTVQERAPPKRRGRRVEPGPSVLQPVGDTHKVILERGAALLGVSPVLNLESQPDVIPETWEERPEMKEADEEDPEMKEEANEEQPEMKEEAAEEELEMKEDEPIMPATQSFAPSKIGGRSRLFDTTSATLNMDSSSGLFYADLPCMVSPASGTRSLSTLELSCSTSPTRSSDSSILFISSSDDSEPDPRYLDHLDNRIRSPVFSDSSASVVVLDSTRSYISRHEPPSPSSPVDSHTSFHPTSRRQSFGEEWNSQEGVYMWEEYNPSRPVSPADYIQRLSLHENDAVFEEVARGRSRSPRPLARSRSRSRRSSRSSKKGSRSPAKRSDAGRKRLSQPAHRSRSREPAGSKSVSRKAKSKKHPQPKSKSHSRSKSRIPSPKVRKKRTARQGSMYASKDNEDGPGTKDLDAKLLDLILQDKELYLRILRYEPIKFEDILDKALKNGIPKHALQSKLRAFLDSQCINFYTAEALGRKKKRHA